MEIKLTGYDVKTIIEKYSELKSEVKIDRPEDIVLFNQDLEVSKNSLQVIYINSNSVPKAHRVFNLDEKHLNSNLFKMILEDSTNLLTKNIFMCINRPLNNDERENLISLKSKLDSIKINVLDIIGINDNKFFSYGSDSYNFKMKMLSYDYYTNDVIDSKLENCTDLYQYAQAKFDFKFTKDEIKDVMIREVMSEELKMAYPFLSHDDILKLSKKAVDLHSESHEEFILVSIKNGK